MMDGGGIWGERIMGVGRTQRRENVHVQVQVATYDCMHVSTSASHLLMLWGSCACAARASAGLCVVCERNCSSLAR